MKKALLALFAVAFAASACFAEEASNQTQASNISMSWVQLHTTTITGKVDSVSTGSGISGTSPQIAVKDDKGEVTTCVVASDAVVIGKDGSSTSLSWISKGDKVSVGYITDDSGIKIARSIKILSTW